MVMIGAEPGCWLAEPAGLRAELLERALTDRTRASGTIAERVADALVGGGAGVMPDALRAAALGYRRELWLWAMGERRWAPTMESLVARAARRTAA